jgi:hypothetical protein
MTFITEGYTFIEEVEFESIDSYMNRKKCEKLPRVRLGGRSNYVSIIKIL